MLTIKKITNNPQEIIDRLKIKNFDAKEKVAQIVELDKEKRNTQKELDDIKAEQNKIAKEIGLLFKENKIHEANKAKARATELKNISKKKETSFSQLDEAIYQLVVQIPNLPHPSVPLGKSDADNEKVKEGGELPSFDFEALPHWDLAKKYDLIDFELGNKLTGAGFPVYKGKGAKLQRALINFFLAEGEKAGYQEIMPPIMVNEQSAYATGQLPDKDGQMYHATVDNFYLIPTAEVPITNIYRDVILEEKDFPIKMTGYTPCFRREAGSYGKDVKGLNRLHQFDKVEIVQIENPKNSYNTLEQMVSYVESLVQKLGLPYRIVKLCGGDLSFTSALTYDFEVYSGAQKRWLEVSSVSNFESFQANRLKLRFKNKETKNKQLAHTLNGSALALPRILASLLENYQTKDGITIPEALVPFTGFDKI